MANCEYHVIYCPGIKTKLLAAGVVSSRMLYPKGYPNGKMYESVLDYSKCHEKEWQKQLEDVLESGVVDFGLRNVDGSYGVRRDFTEEEKAMLPLYPIHFSDNDHVEWYSKWRHNEDPLIYITMALPTEIMYFSAFYESACDGCWYVRDGKHYCDAPQILVRPGEYQRAVNDARIGLQNCFLAEKIPVLEERASKCTTAKEYERVLLDFVDFYQNHPQYEITEEDLPF